VLICNFVCDQQEKKILVIIWLVANALITGLGSLALIIIVFMFKLDTLFLVAIGIGIGESASLFTLWVCCTIVNTESLQFECDVHC
jgi:hypothetical protein